MKWVLATLLALFLAGCADSGSFDRERPVEQLVAPTEQILPPTKSMRPKSVEAKAAASKPNATKQSSLMECVSNACQIQCSAQVEKQSRPKWCSYFKEPTEGPAASTPSDTTRLELSSKRSPGC